VKPSRKQPVELGGVDVRASLHDFAYLRKPLKKTMIPCQ
jgi:hypothetical protein